MIFSQQKRSLIKMLSFAFISLLFFNCNYKENKYILDNILKDPNYKNFAKRTNDMFGEYSHPLLFPIEKGANDCNGFKLRFNLTSNLKDTLKGVVELEDNNGISFDYRLMGIDSVYRKYKNGYEIYLLPNVEGIIGFYIYEFRIGDTPLPYRIKLVTSKETIILYEDGDKKGPPQKNWCNDIYEQFQDTLYYKTPKLEEKDINLILEQKTI